jgi:hypothetical protein
MYGIGPPSSREKIFGFQSQIMTERRTELFTISEGVEVTAEGEWRRREYLS